MQQELKLGHQITGNNSDYRVTLDYTDDKGVKASTTDNVYGIYDLNGGAYEFVSAYVNNGNDNLLLNGTSLVNGEEKNKNVYDVGSEDTMLSNYEMNKSKYGDSLWEVSNTNAHYIYSWYHEPVSFPYGDYSFFIRGGIASQPYQYNDQNSGSFTSSRSSGLESDTCSFRPVLVVL